MKLSDFDYQLPEQLIAKFPSSKRCKSRLLAVDKVCGSLEHVQFEQIIDLLNPEDCLICNDTRVIPARIKGQKSTGGQIELMFERLLDEQLFLAQIRASHAPKPGSTLCFSQDIHMSVVGRDGPFFVCRFEDDRDVMAILDLIGEIPLPPYFERDPEAMDKERYQTVYAKHHGAVAAPTAGLHFDEALLEKIKQHGIDVAYLTLHVGAGTYQPVRAENITDHKMHAEYINVSEEVCATVNKTKQRGGRVIAVGTTSVRSLESAAQEGELKPFQGNTDIFIYPGYEFKVVDGLITNFHLPKSSLLMLVSALAGREHIMQAYQAAIVEQYRFYSYGDAMFIR